MLKYSIVIPIYNVEKYLEKCVNSILDKPTDSEYEIILVNDGSTDSSGSICDTLAASDNRVRVIHQENGWVGKARNTGINAANGEFIMFLDPDDHLMANVFELLDNIIDDDTDIVKYNYWRICDDEDISPGEETLLTEGCSGKEYIQSILDQGNKFIPFVWCYAFRNTFLAATNIKFRENIRISEDYIFLLETLPLCNKIIATNEKIVGYIDRKGSLSNIQSSNKLLTNILCRAEFFEKFTSSVFANEFTHQVLLCANFKGDEYKVLTQAVKDNVHIIDHVSTSTLKVARILIKIFGVRAGIKIFDVLQKFKNTILHKT